MPSNGPRNEIIAARRERQTRHLEILKTGISDIIANQSEKNIFDAGLPITAGLSINRVATKMILLAELVRTWRAVRLPDSRSWQNQDDLQSAIDDVVDMFPTLKIEEFARVMQMIRRGEITLFGRFDTPSLIGALRNYEEQYTITFRENQHHERAHHDLKTRTSDGPSPEDVKRFSDFVKSLDLPRPKKTISEMGGSIQLTESEMLQITKPFNDETSETQTD